MRKAVHRQLKGSPEMTHADVLSRIESLLADNGDAMDLGKLTDEIIASGIPKRIVAGGLTRGLHDNTLRMDAKQRVSRTFHRTSSAP